MAGFNVAKRKTSAGLPTAQRTVPAPGAAVTKAPAVAKAPAGTTAPPVAQVPQVAAAQAADRRLERTPVEARPVAALDYTQADQDVLSNVNRVASQDSALMKSARTAGFQLAGRRGLLNSSMAVGAAQGEVLKKSVEIGGQNAQQNADANLENQKYLQTRNLNEQGYEQDRALTLIEEAGLNDRLERDIAAQEERLGRQLSQEERLNTANNLAAQERLDTQIAADRGEKALDREATATQNRLDRQSRERLERWGLDQQSQASAATQLTTINSNYESALAEIMRNEDLTSAQRTQQINALNARREIQYETVQTLWGIDISWPAPARGSTQNPGGGGGSGGSGNGNGSGGNGSGGNGNGSGGNGNSGGGNGNSRETSTTPDVTKINPATNRRWRWDAGTQRYV